MNWSCFGFRVYLLLLVALVNAIEAFKITKCGSNKISQVSFDHAKKKALIKFDESLIS